MDIFSNIEQLPEGNPNMLQQHEKLFYTEAEKLDPRLRKSLFWCMRLMMEAGEESKVSYNRRQLENLKKVDGYFDSGFGQIELENDQTAFGMVVYSNSDESSFLGDIFNPRFDNKEGFLEVDGIKFPITLKQIIIRQHCFDSNPPFGTGTCYAGSVFDNKATGIVTAKHVAEDNYPTCTLSCNCDASTHSVTPFPIDGAFMTSECWLKGESRLREFQPPKIVVAGMPVSFCGAVSGNVHTEVLHTSGQIGIYDSPYVPHRIFLKHHGVKGDSGALVQGNEPVGIYVGEGEDENSGKTVGIAQHLYQVQRMLDLKLYK